MPNETKTPTLQDMIEFIDDRIKCQEQIRDYAKQYNAPIISPEQDEKFSQQELFLLRAIRERLAGVEGWQNIETAPKDGKPVLLIGFSENAKIPVTGFWNASAWYLDDGENCFVDDVYEGSKTIRSPSHWMPMPAAPAPGDKN